MKPFRAVSNLAYGGLPVALGRPGDEESFETQAEAAAWLRSLRCGGSISAHDGQRFPNRARSVAGHITD